MDLSICRERGEAKGERGEGAKPLRGGEERGERGEEVKPRRRQA